MPATDANFWRRRAAREARRFNLGWWVQMTLPWMVGLGLGAAVVVLGLRSAGLSLALVPAAFGAGAVLGMAVAFLQARQKFLTREEALVRLDADLRLHSRLASAASGVGDWPPARPDAALALRWKWPVVLRLPAAAGLVLCAAVVVPLPDGRAKTIAARGEPAAWTAVAEQIADVRQEDIVEPEPLDQLEAALEALRDQPSDQWFRHESLEAGDHLQSRLNRSLAELQGDLQNALGALEAARSLEAAQVAALSQPLASAFGEAVKSLEGGPLPLDKDMLSRLQNLDPSKARQLSEAEWKQLSERLKNGIGACSNGSCNGEGEGSRLLVLILGQPGRGGVSRGPGSAPLTLGDEETRLGSTRTEAVSNDDLSRAALGDLMGIGTGEHAVDRTATAGPGPAGSISAAGLGSEAVRQQTATPAEQGALRKFFQ